MSSNPCTGASGARDESTFVSAVVQRHNSDPRNLLQILREVQDRYGHISAEALQAISTGLWIPRVRVEGVARFYTFLTARQRGRYDVLFSDSITDHMLGKQALMDYFCERMGIRADQTRADKLVSVDNTSCTGMCDQGPAVLVNGVAVTHLDRGRVERIVELINGRVPLADWPPELFRVTDNIHRADVLLDERMTPGDALRASFERGAAATLGEVRTAKLRGRGGAGFPTATKWDACRNAPGERKYVVCNADEGEPGTFKDRVLLQSYADLVVEGMTVAAYVIGASRGYIYLRAEYRYMAEALTQVLDRRRRAGLLGSNVLGREGFDFDIDMHLGAGAYICGEESALIESLEGKRGVPRKRPPFPVTHGYRQRPTVVNNVETFAQAAQIAVRGGDWFAGIGTDESKGTKLLSVAGDCARPGIYEYPFGVTIRHVLHDCGARDPQAVQIAGPAGHTLSEREFDRRLAFEDVPTGGSFMVFDHSRDMLEVARNFAGFFAHESCGFCTPCRVGTTLMKNLVEKVWTGHGTETDLQEMRTVADVMRHTSHCGLGQTAGNPVMDVLDKFPDTCTRRLRAAVFQPAFDLDGALCEARSLTGRDDTEAHL